jgi:pimeloyl-ACP methyl ester carboxylesterase
MRMKSLRVLVWMMALLCLGLLADISAAQDSVPVEDLADENGHFIEVDGVRLYYVEEGPADGPAVLLLHGFGASTVTWRDNITPLAEAGYRVVAFDRPPYGLADKDPSIEYTPERYTELMAGLMNALEIETAALVGHSAGGTVIGHFAERYPERVTVLVFVAGAVRVEGMDVPVRDWSDEQSQQSPFAPLFRVASQLNPESPLAAAGVRLLVTPELLEQIARANYYDPESVSEETLQGYTRVLQVEGWERAFLRLLNADVSSGDTLSQQVLLDVDVPVLIIWGEEDPTVPLAFGEALAAGLPHAVFITYPLTGHMPMEEQTERFNTDLLEFLNRHLAEAS